ncbi:MAG: leucine-rich repeat domain-containing protein [Elusimicrobiales bacterium]|nr:leucine-rich repeat domain-containing protein [Elusimicrobiales bacterium]
MAISKIVYKENAEATPVVWMDTTDKTADSGNMLNGITALKNDGTTATGNIQSQAAQTIYPSTSDQTIASGKYLTGAQTVKGVLLTNLSAGNIKKDVVVKVGDSADDDRITSVTGTYEGSGGGGVTPAEEKDVNFIDYDGTIVYSYTKTEFANLSALPANPSHDGLTAQGWNWSLSDAKTYVASYGKLWIGQQYIVNSGATEIDIILEKGRTSPYLALCPNGTVEVDWGDGSTHSTVTGTSEATQVLTLHQYINPGIYTIKISILSGYCTIGNNSTYPLLSNNNSNSTRNQMYSSSIKAIRVAGDMSTGPYAFNYCRNLQYIIFSYASEGIISNGSNMFQYSGIRAVVVPESEQYYNITNIFRSATYLEYSSIPNLADYAVLFNSATAMRSTIIPSGATSIPGSSFDGCYSLSNITIPNGVTTIGSSAFYNCYGLGEIHFTPTSPPTVSNSNAFNNLPTDCIIYVPYSADHSVLDAYTSANNYPSSSTYTYVEET